MRYSIFAVAFSALALAQDFSASTPVVTSVVASNPATQYLTETNSRGVVTGQPIPRLSQTAAASIPAGLSSVPVVPSVSGISTVVTASRPLGTGSSPNKNNSSGAVSSSSGASRTVSGPSSSGTGSSSKSSKSSSTNGAVMATAAPAGLGLGMAGAIFAAFL